MIPTIETIVEDVLAGRITRQQAIEWLHQHAEQAGRDLRDEFAVMALTAAAQDERDNPTSKTYEAVAIRAYHYADAMIAQRNK